MSALSVGNSRPWYFVIIRDQETLAEISKIHQYYHMITGASAAILVCGDKQAAKYLDVKKSIITGNITINRTITVEIVISPPTYSPASNGTLGINKADEVYTRIGTS